MKYNAFASVLEIFKLGSVKHFVLDYSLHVGLESFKPKGSIEIQITIF